MSNYTIYHLHTELSNCITNIDSVNNYKQYIDRAKELGMSAIGFSEHGGIFNHLHKKEYAESNGIKYLHGVEMYITETLETKIRDNYHVVLIAKNFEGFLELNTLVSKSFNRADVKILDDNERFYYTPRISMQELMQTSDNIMITTACIGSIFGSKKRYLKRLFLEFMQKNNHRCFLEIQHHNIKEQIYYNKNMFKYSRKYNIRLIAGTDTHSLNEEYAEGRIVLQKAKRIYFDNESGWDLVFKSYDELVQSYRMQNSLPERVYLRAIENTNILADLIDEFKINRGIKYPSFSDNPKEDVLRIVSEGLKVRNVDMTDEIQQRIDYEIDTYEHNGAFNLLLLEDDIKSYARANGIAYGDSRGSVSGSYVAYLMQITNVDSIKHNLNFERFMNTERVSLADIDTDWSPSQRETIKQYIHDNPKYHSAEIITFNTIADRGAIRDVSRALEIPLDIINEICDTFEVSEDRLRKEYPELFKYVDLLKGVTVSMGSHPAASICSPISLYDNIGLITLSTNSHPVSCLNMKEIDSLNFVKLDVLGLDNVEIIAKTCDLAGIERLTCDNVDDKDEKVWKDMMKSGLCIFQFESPYAFNYLKNIFKPEIIEKIRSKNKDLNYIDLMSISNGAIRPAGESYREALSLGEFNDNDCNALNNMLKSTNGFLVYQEQIIEFLNKFCGFSMGQADKVRRCVDGDTLITVSNGNVKPIKELMSGDKVISVSEQGVTQYNTVNHVFDNGVQECYKIQTMHNNYILATKDHKVLTQDGYKTIEDLSLDDYIMTIKKINGEKDGLRPNQRLSNKEMFLIGMLIGDGTIYKYTKIKQEENFAPSFTNSDIALIDKFKDCVIGRIRGRDCEFNVSESNGISVDKIYNISVKTKTAKQSLINLLDKYDLRHHSANKILPNDFMSYPADEKIKNLLGGLFSTDGGYCNDHISYYTTSKILALQIKNILLKFSIYSIVYSKYVKDYNYDAYEVYIGQPNSLLNFKNNIVPFVVGKKKEKYIELIDSEILNEKNFNYLLPPKCIDEILESEIVYKKSRNSIGMALGYDSNNFNYHSNAISDVKAKKIINELYIPYAYWLLSSEYIPLKIVSIECVGMRHVYDIEVDKNHNYIANSLVVHNCFAKKLGTEQYLPQIKSGFVETMKIKYNIPEEESKKIIISFLKVIEDASSYLFSLNHALPYSYIGYICGWLRYYYPLEFITVILNINEDDQEKTGQIFDYIKNFTDIRIKPIKFRMSKSQYTMNKEENTIYKGIKSIKYCNSQIAEELYLLKDNIYTCFSELLLDINNTSINSRQLDILIKLNFFSEFGNSKFLLKILECFEYLNNGSIKQLSIDKIEKQYKNKENFIDGSILFGIIQRHSTPPKNKTGKTYKELNVKAIMTELEEYFKCDIKQDFSVLDKIKFQEEFLGYIDLTTEKPEDRKKLLVLGVSPMISKKNKKVWAYVIDEMSIGSGIKNRLTIAPDVFNSKPLKIYDVIDVMNDCNVYKNKKGYWNLSDYQKIIF